MFVVEATDYQRKRFSHRRDVGGDVERIGRDQKKNQPQYQPAGRHFHHIGRKALSSHPADLSAYQLNRDHERRCEKYGPKQAVTKLGTCLRIGSNARRIIIGSARHQSRAEQPQD